MKPNFYDEYGSRFFITPTIMIDFDFRVVFIGWLFWSVQFYLKNKKRDKGPYYNLKWEYEFENGEEIKDEKI